MSLSAARPIVLAPAVPAAADMRGESNFTNLVAKFDTSAVLASITVDSAGGGASGRTAGSAWTTVSGSGGVARGGGPTGGMPDVWIRGGGGACRGCDTGCLGGGALGGIGRGGAGTPGLASGLPTPGSGRRCGIRLLRQRGPRQGGRPGVPRRPGLGRSAGLAVLRSDRERQPRSLRVADVDALAVVDVDDRHPVAVDIGSVQRAVVDRQPAALLEPHDQVCPGDPRIGYP